MYCLKCKNIIPDGLENCPDCGTPTKPDRCPECWVKMEKEENICKKCGCDVERYLKEKEEDASKTDKGIFQKISELKLWIKITAISVAVLLIAGAIGVNAYLHYNAFGEAQKHCEDLISYSHDSMEMLTEMAELYESKVYNKDWLVHTENATKLRQDYKGKISEIEKTREPIIHANERVAKTGIDELSYLANDVYYAYSDCYAYVIGEKGKYPHYLDKYMNLLDKYEEAAKKLEKAIE